MDTIKSIISVCSDIMVALSNVRDEINSYDKLGEFFTEDFALYTTSIKEIHKVASIFDELNYSKLLEHRTVDFLIMTHIHNELKPHKEFFKFINVWFHRNNCCYLLCCICSSSNRLPNIMEKMRENLECVKKQLITMNNLKRQVFGSSIRIEHPVFRQAWLLVGENQLNDTSIHQNVLSDNFYQLIKNIAGEDESDKKDWENKIYALLQHIEDETVSERDSHISIIELNNLNYKFKKCKTVLDVLDIIDIDEYIKSKEDESKEDELKEDELKEDEPLTEDEPLKEEDVNIEIEPIMPKKKEEIIQTTFEDSVEINYNTQNSPLDNCEGYGSDFPAEKVCQFVIPDLEQKVICAEVEMIACDQNWGGTGHVQVRYKVNEGKHEHAFNVNRSSCPDNQYLFNIKGTELSSKDRVELFILCPKWGGWSASVSSVNVKLKFKI